MKNEYAKQFKSSTPTIIKMLAFILVLAQATWLGAAEQKTITGTAADATLNQNSTWSNYGGCSTFTVLTASSRNPNQNQRGIFRFDLTSLSGASVKTSSVSLYLSSISGVTRTHELHRVTNTSHTWTEGNGGCSGSYFSGVSWQTLDGWNYNWTTAGGDFDSTLAASANTGTTNGTTINFGPMLNDSTTNFVQNWINNSSSNMGFIIKDAAENSGRNSTTATYNSRSSGSNKPSMTITYLRPVTLATPTIGVSDVTLNWTFPSGTSASNYNGVLVSFRQGSTAPSGIPVDGTAYNVGAVLATNEIVGANTSSYSTVSAKVENGPDYVIAPNTQYRFALFSHDNSTITGAASAVPPHYSGAVTSSTVTTVTGGGTVKNWSYKMAFAALSAPALAPGGEIVASGNDGIMHSMSPSTGVRQYVPGTSAGGLGYIGKPVRSTSVIVPRNYLDSNTLNVFGSKCAANSCDVGLMGSDDGTVWAFNVRTGQKLWQSPVLTNTSGTIIGAPLIQLRAFSNSTFRNRHTNYDLVIVGTHNNNDTTGNKVYGLRSDDGTVVWTSFPGNMDIVNSTPALDYDTNNIWVTSLSKSNTQPSLWKIDSVTGNWTAPISMTTATWDIGGSPVLNHYAQAPYLYAVTEGGDLIAVNTSTNALVVAAHNYGSGIAGRPSVFRNSTQTGDEIYFSNSNGVHKATFSYSTAQFSVGWSSTVVSYPSVPLPNAYPTPTALFVGGNNGYLYKLYTSNGTLADSRLVNAGSIIGDPNLDVVNGKIYVGDGAGRVYSYDVF